MQMDVHKMRYPFYITSKISHITTAVTKMRFVDSDSQVYYDDFHHRLYGGIPYFRD